jgi:AraC-like DNA-binding protein
MELDSRDVPAAERFGWWCEVTSRDLMPTWIDTHHVGDFRARATQLTLGEVELSTLEFPALRSARTPQLIRRSDPERWELALVSAGSMCLEQHRRSTRLAPGELVLFDTSRPFDSTAEALAGPASVMILHLPRRAVPLPERALRALAARRMPTRRGVAAVLRRCLTEIGEQTPALDGAPAHRLGSAAVDLATAVLAERADAEDRLPRHRSAVALRQQITAFIADNLDDPELTPAAVAAAHHISLRYLHRLFQQQERGVAAYIREERLRRCRTDLADPLLAGRAVTEIGAHWGFRDPVGFNRVFKRAYGLPPGQYRRHAARPRRQPSVNCDLRS